MHIGQIVGIILDVVIIAIGVVHVVNPRMTARYAKMGREFFGQVVKENAPVFRPFMQRLFGFFCIGCGLAMLCVFIYLP